MKTSYISTVTLMNGPRSTIGQTQSDLNKALAEQDSGRFADVGLELGYKTKFSLDFYQRIDDLKAQSERNGLTSVWLSSTQNALNQVRSDGEAFLALMVPGELSDGSATAIAQTATSKLSAFIGEMNASINGQYVFGGINTGVPPIADYQSTPTSAAKQAFTQAFQSAFGFPPGTQPDAAAITASQMQSFLDSPAFTGQFDLPHWKANWSAASDVNIRSQIQGKETAETSVNANSTAVRQLAMMYTLGSEIGLPSLSSATQNVIYDKLRSLAGSATFGITQIQANFGIVQARIEAVGKQRDVQKDIFQTGLKSLEGVDPIEAGSRVAQLQSQVQVAYTLTGQISKLSIINYI